MDTELLKHWFMAAIEDHSYLKICAQLASCLSISIASARRKVELVAARDGIRDLSARKAIAERLLEQARSLPQKGEDAVAVQFDQLLAALAEEENFMVED